MRRVINGYEFTGTQHEELLRQKIAWATLSKDKKHKALLDQVESVENLESHRFDRIRKEIKDSELIVTGEKKVAKQAAGLGGDFTYYTLGEPLDIDKILTGESLPDYASLGSWLFHTGTGEPVNQDGIDQAEYYLGESAQYHVWLVYEPDLDFLKSREAALNLNLAQKIAGFDAKKRHLVFAPGKFVPNKTLLPMGVEYAPLPFALYRMERD